MSITSIRVTHGPPPRAKRALSLLPGAIFRDANKSLYLRCGEGCVRIGSSGLRPYSEGVMGDRHFRNCVEVQGRVNIHVELE